MAEYAHESSGLGASSSLLTLYRHSGERIMDMEAAQLVTIFYLSYIRR